jgi:hypothetical protein
LRYVAGLEKEMTEHEGSSGREVVKDDECSDREWEDVKVVVKEVVVEEVVKRMVVMEKGEEKVVSLAVVVEEAQWEESRMKAKPSQESERTHERSEHQKRKDMTHRR